MSADWTHYMTLLTPLVVFILGLVAMPILRNIANEKIEQIKTEIVEIKKEEHHELLQAIQGVEREIASHKSDAYAHGNLEAIKRIETKIDNLSALSVDIVAMRADLMSMRSLMETRPCFFPKGSGPRRKKVC